jgi:predicted TIM-barrel fold metal-dependent hydrolase
MILMKREGRKMFADKKNGVVDVHIHFGSPKDTSSGCYWSKEFEQTAAYIAILLLTRSVFKKLDFKSVQKHLMSIINESKFVNKSVILALDQVYDEAGVVHPEWTHLYVPNQCIIDTAKNNSRVLVGASVHPYRRDWESEIDCCLENRVVLCKWMPLAQKINPEHSRCLSFYKKLADCRLPLLCHAGPEYTIPTSDHSYDEYNNPKYLRKALDLGVTVIIAHCALPYFWLLDVDYQDDLMEFLRLFDEAEKKKWNLYADLSALTGFFRLPYIKEEILRLPHERLLFGSDYPIPLSELSYNKHTRFISWLWFILKVIALKNPLDKNFLLVREMGFRDCVFENANRLFSLIKY